MPRKKQTDPETWISWKFPEVEEMDWRAKQEFMIPELNMSWGKACGTLRKCWRGFHTSKRKGDEEKMNEYARRIVSIQQAMGIQEADFGFEILF